ncbi:MAG: YifB family Mg chelatase-like AAA ATPase [Candidatus Ancillula sp.]|jgi:magnesium chelatase family protein|nr:YifB family Mg chelatase-like AAA ATPase [Candidatus Ancillula sp.]
MSSKLASCKSVSLIGLKGSIVNVEANMSMGLAQFTIVGLPDASVNESRARVLTAFGALGVNIQECHITVNLAPASLPKRGSGFDLAIAVVVLASAGVLERDAIVETAFLGELGLDGRVLPVKGILPEVLAAREAGLKQVYVPIGNETEAKLVDGIQVCAVGHLAEVMNEFGGKIKIPDYVPAMKSLDARSRPKGKIDFADVLGQKQAKFALEVAAAGFHNMMMTGPPGTGKSMLAARLPTILPDLEAEDSLVATCIYSISGENIENLITIPPFESPHHTATTPSIIGGGSGSIRPGSISRAHCGVLFLDEAPEFSPRVLQTLRQPLESGEVVIDRARSHEVFPARVLLVMAANPCPCGMYSSQNDKCKCSSIERRRYFGRLSGPLLDRIDIMTTVENVTKSHLKSDTPESSAEVKARVEEARRRAKFRWKDTPWKVNSQVPGSYLRRIKLKDTTLLDALAESVDRQVLSMRGADRALRLAWTLADLTGADEPASKELLAALQLKGNGLDA